MSSILLAGYKARNLLAPNSHKIVKVDVEFVLICDQTLYVASRGRLFKYGLNSENASQECVLSHRIEEPRDKDVITSVVAYETGEFGHRFALIQSRHSAYNARSCCDRCLTLRSGYSPDPKLLRSPRVRIVQECPESFSDVQTFLMPVQRKSLAAALYGNTFARAVVLPPCFEKYLVEIYKYQSAPSKNLTFEVGEKVVSRVCVC